VDYYRLISKPGLLDRAQEAEMAEELATIRQEAWARFLSYDPVLPHVAGVVIDMLPRQTPRDALDAFEVCAKANYRRRGNAQQELPLEDHPIDVAAGYGIRYDPGLDVVTRARAQVLAGNTPYEPQHYEPELEWGTETDRLVVRYQRIKNRFVRSNLRLVIPLARSYASFGLMPLDDLIQEGNLGLMKAVDRFDHSQGNKFSTYAMWWIRHAVNRAMADKARTVRLPAHLVGAMSKLRKAERQMNLDGESWDDAEFARRCGMTVDKLVQVRRYKEAMPLSLDQGSKTDEHVPVRDLIPDLEAPDFDALIDDRSQQEWLEGAIQKLPAIEASILRGRFGLEGEPQTLNDLAIKHKLSRERIRQIQETGIEHLRKALERKNKRYRVRRA